MKNQNDMIELLKKEFPKMWLKPSEDFSREFEGGIWTGEGSIDNDGLPMFDYWSHEESIYEMGVRKTLLSLLEKHGWWAECYDAGTYMLMPE
jgi:hypothetical protein